MITGGTRGQAPVIGIGSGNNTGQDTPSRSVFVNMKQAARNRK